MNKFWNVSKNDFLHRTLEKFLKTRAQHTICYTGNAGEGSKVGVPGDAGEAGSTGWKRLVHSGPASPQMTARHSEGLNVMPRSTPVLAWPISCNDHFPRTVFMLHVHRYFSDTSSAVTWKQREKAGLSSWSGNPDFWTLTPLTPFRSPFNRESKVKITLWLKPWSWETKQRQETVLKKRQ